MSVLVIDTALGSCTVGVCEGDRVLGERSQVMARGHSERLGGFVRDAVSDAGGGFEAIERIGVTVGPGSFTGLRVGLAFALGLGQALGRPVVGLSSLQALAWSSEGGPSGRVGAAIDARRGEVYAQAFLDGVPVEDPIALRLDDPTASPFGVGDGLRWVGDGAGLVTADPGPVLVAPTIIALATLTRRLDPADHPPRPLYLRAPDATPPTRLPGQARATGPAR